MKKQIAASAPTTPPQSADPFVIPIQATKAMRKAPSIESLAAAGSFVIVAAGKCYSVKITDDGRPYLYTGGNNTATWNHAAGIAIADKVYAARHFCREQSAASVERLRATVLGDDGELWAWLTDRQIKLYIIEQCDHDDHEQTALTLLRESLPASVHPWLPASLGEDGPLDLSGWTSRQRKVGRALEERQGNMASDEIKAAIGSNESMAHIFRDTNLIGPPESNTEIVRVKEKVYCLRRYFRP